MSPRLPQNAADRARRAPERGPRSAGVWPIRRSRQNDIASRLQRESRRQQNPTPPDSLVRGRALSGFLPYSVVAEVDKVTPGERAARLLHAAADHEATEMNGREAEARDQILHEFDRL